MQNNFSNIFEKIKKVRVSFVFLVALLLIFYVFGQIFKAESILAESSTTTQNTTSTTSSQNSTAPLPPTGFTVMTGPCDSAKIYIGWQASPNALGYRVVRNDTVVYEGPNLTFLDSNLTPDTSYSYNISSYNQYGSSPIVSGSGKSPKACVLTTTTSTTQSSTTTTPTSTTPTSTNTNTINIATTTILTPPSPTGIIITPGPCGIGKINVYWQPTPRATGYRVYADNAVVYEGPNSSFVDSGQLGMSRSYRIISYNSYGISDGTSASSKFPNSCPVAVTASSTTSGTISTTPPLVEQIPPTTFVKDATIPTNTTKTAPIPTETTNKIIPTTTTVPPPQPPQNIEIVISTTTAQLQNISSIVESTKNAVEQAKLELKKVITNKISDGTKNLNRAQMELISDELTALIQNLLNGLDNDLAGLTTLTPEKINSVKLKVSNGLKQIDVIFAKVNTTNQSPKISEQDSQQIKNVLATLTTQIDEGSRELKQQGGDLLYKDSNHDGISDYESKNIYHIDPVKPSPVTVYEGKKITAGEKVLLGFDPTQPDLVKVTPEEPKVSPVPITPSYKVKDIVLSPEKKVVMKGTALPNSFVTIYIYSTPIIVTIKTNSDGEWQYTLDKELDSGQHTVYTATVNNTGKIVAKSTGFAFIKTAEAATLGTLPPVQVSSEAKKPALLENNNMFIIIAIFAIIFGVALMLVGVNSKNDNQV